jgi:hypothetical protein
MSSKAQERLKIDSPRTISKRKVVKIKRMHPITGEITSEVPNPPFQEQFLTFTEE